MAMSAEYTVNLQPFTGNELIKLKRKILEGDEKSQTSKTKKIFEWSVSVASLTFTFD